MEEVILLALWIALSCVVVITLVGLFGIHLSSGQAADAERKAPRGLVAKLFLGGLLLGWWRRDE